MYIRSMYGMATMARKRAPTGVTRPQAAKAVRAAAAATISSVAAVKLAAVPSKKRLSSGPRMKFIRPWMGTKSVNGRLPKSTHCCQGRISSPPWNRSVSTDGRPRPPLLTKTARAATVTGARTPVSVSGSPRPHRRTTRHPLARATTASTATRRPG